LHEMQSPLVGFLSGLLAFETAYAFAVPYDASFVAPEIIRTLFEHQETTAPSPCLTEK
jgi:molybdopterin-guanine dinucleotide biosynthesis protein A